MDASFSELFHHHRVRSDLFLNVFAGEFRIAKNLGEEATADGLATMDGNDGASAVGVPEEVVAPLDPNDFKTKVAKRPNELGAAE